MVRALFLAKEDVLPYMFLSFPLENGKESHEEILVLRKQGRERFVRGSKAFLISRTHLYHMCVNMAFFIFIA
jgi:hypothetical protein